MDEITDKEKLLKNIRNALIDKVENPFHDLDLDSSVYPPIEESPDIYFVRRFIEVGGKFVYCANELELSENLSDLLVNENLFPVFTPDERIRYLLLQNGIDVIHNEDDFYEMKTGITSCEYLVARTGSIVFSSRLSSGRRMITVPEVHIVIAHTSQIVVEIKEALANIRLKYQKQLPSFITFVTGPSRTSDIEKTLVIGAHWPAKLYLFLIEEEIKPIFENLL